MDNMEKDMIKFYSKWFKGLFKAHIAKKIKKTYGIQLDIDEFEFDHDDATKKVMFKINAAGEMSEDAFSDLIAKALK